MWVHIYDEDEDGKTIRKWVPGMVDQVHDIGDNEEYKIRVVIKDEQGEWVRVPKILRDNTYDPIQGIPSDKLQEYIIQRDEGVENISDIQYKLWRCFKFHSTGKKSDEEPQNIIDESLLGDSPNDSTSMRNILRTIMADDTAKNVVKHATGNDTCSAQHALAYFIGQLCGIELSECVSSEDVDPKGLLDQIGSNNVNVDCPMSRVFLMSAMVARTHKTKELHPTASLYDWRARKVFSDPEKLRSRMSRLKTALAAIHSSQTEQPSLSGPSIALLSHGIHLMIDMRGTSDRLLDSLAEEGVCRPARVLRVWIQKIAEAIDPLSTRSPPPAGETLVLCHTADNADYHLFHTCVSVVPVGSILLGIESVEDTKHFNEHFMKGLPSPSSITPEDLAATKEDDEIAQEIIDTQNIVAILTASLSNHWLSDQQVSNPSGSSARPTAGSNVTFLYRSEDREGTVTKVSGSEAHVKFVDGGREITRPILLKHIASVQPASVTQDATSSASSNDTNSERKNRRQPEMFGGERHKFRPSTTSIAGVLAGLSSKNNDTARQVIQEIITKCGEEEFFNAVHMIVADQEFMPTMMSEFFSRLKTEEELPIIPALAIGHAIKGLSVSMMSYYQCFFDPMLDAMGIKVGSPEYNKFYKGSVIRNTNDLVANSTEMLALAAAHKYLTKVGDDNRIELGKRSVSPKAIIGQYFDQVNGNLRPCRTTRSKTAMDPNTRPVQVKLLILWFYSLKISNNGRDVNGVQQNGMKSGPRVSNERCQWPNLSK